MRASEIKIGQRYLIDRSLELCGGESFGQNVNLTFIVFADGFTDDKNYIKVSGFIGKAPKQQYFKTVMNIKCFVEKVTN